MGLLTDMRTGERDRLGPYAIAFWFFAGLVIGNGLGAYASEGSHKAVLALAVPGAAVGLCIGFYAAFGKSRLATALALPGALLAIFG